MSADCISLYTAIYYFQVQPSVLFVVFLPVSELVSFLVSEFVSLLVSGKGSHNQTIKIHLWVTLFCSRNDISLVSQLVSNRWFEEAVLLSSVTSPVSASFIGCTLLIALGTVWLLWFRNALCSVSYIDINTICEKINTLLAKIYGTKALNLVILA